MPFIVRPPWWSYKKWHGRHERLQLCARSDKKFGERDSVANCQPTILRFSPIRESGHLEPFGEWNHNPNWPPPILRKIQTNKNQRSLGISGDWKSRSTEILSWKTINADHLHIWDFNIGSNDPIQPIQHNKLGLLGFVWLIPIKIKATGETKQTALLAKIIERNG